MRDNPSLKGKPMGVLSTNTKTILSTTNYEARKLGIVTGMPLFIAKNIYPQLEVVHPNMKKYEEASKQLAKLLYDFDPFFMQNSIDEADLHISPFIFNLFQKLPIALSIPNPLDPRASSTLDSIIQDVIKDIKLKVLGETQLTCSIGCGSNNLLAKIAAKKNKVFIIH